MRVEYVGNWTIRMKYTPGMSDPRSFRVYITPNRLFCFKSDPLDDLRRSKMILDDLRRSSTILDKIDNVDVS